MTATHTLGAYLLLLVPLGASQWIVPERLFPWLGVGSGLLVSAIGASLAISRLVGLGRRAPSPSSTTMTTLTTTGITIIATRICLPPSAHLKSLFALRHLGRDAPVSLGAGGQLAAIALGRIAFGLV